MGLIPSAFGGRSQQPLSSTSTQLLDGLQTRVTPTTPPPPTHSPPTHCLRTRPRRAHRMMSGDYSLTLVCAVRLCMLCTRPAPADIPASVALAFCARYPCQMHSHAVHVCVVVGVCVLST